MLLTELEVPKHYICTLHFVEQNISLGGAGSEKNRSFKKNKNQNLNFKYFLEMSSEMKSTRPFYPKLKPNTQYVKKGVTRGPKNLKQSHN